MKIVLGAVISLVPFSAGMAWNWMHLAVGLRRLGCDVIYVEEVDPAWSVDRDGHPCPFDRSYNRELFAAIMERFGFTGSASQVLPDGTAALAGLSLPSLLARIRGADLLLNVAGHVKSEAILASATRRVYIDQDPVFTQLWMSEYGKDLNFDAHEAFVTVGLNIGTPYCAIPDCGVDWGHLLPPVVLDFWPGSGSPPRDEFTTIASWMGFRDVAYRGEWYSSKYQEFARFASLPRLSGQHCELALRRQRDDDPILAEMRGNGWSVVDASRAGDLDTYRSYAQSSRAEIGIAKHAYVKASSGWFSDRSAHYLAAGRPVLAQSTGFERVVPTGRGLLTFRAMDEAQEGIGAINADYAGHCRSARELAAEHLDYRRVLPPLLDFCCAPAREQSVTARREHQW